MLPQFSTSCRQIWQVHKVIAEDVNRPGKFWNSAPVVFYDPIRAVFYAANREFSLNACRKSIMRTIKNPQDGIRVKIVLKLTNKLKMVEIETISRVDVKKWNKQFELWWSHLFYKPTFLKQYFHHHLDNFISFPLVYSFVGIWCVLTELYGKLKTPLKVNGNLKATYYPRFLFHYGND